MTGVYNFDTKTFKSGLIGLLADVLTAKLSGMKIIDETQRIVASKSKSPVTRK